MNNEYDDSVVGNVIDSYSELGSIAKVAASLGLSTVKVRKILITHGLWESKTSRAICEKYAMGITTEAIAYSLGTSVNNVLAYTPYDRGIYLKENRSEDAINSSNYRSRKKSASINQVYSSSAGNGGMACSDSVIDDCDVPYVVHLELDFGDDLSDNEVHILKDYCHCSNGRSITRDIVVPGDFTLYALHYAIQRLYGWLNYHGRRFCLPKERRNELTGGKFGEVLDLSGILFRYDLFDEDGYYITDDYDDSISFASWLRRKYTGPYRQVAAIEDYDSQQELVHRYLKENPTSELFGFGKRIEAPTRECPVDDLQDCYQVDLLFRLPLAMVLAPKGKKLLSMDEWMENVDYSNKPNPRFPYATDTLLYDYDSGDGWSINITRPVDIHYSDRVFREVVETHCPVCIAKDGTMLMEDVGGIWGYLEFMNCVVGKVPSENFDFEDPEEALEWAKGVCWSNRNISFENML